MPLKINSIYLYSIYRNHNYLIELGILQGLSSQESGAGEGITSGQKQTTFSIKKSHSDLKRETHLEETNVLVKNVTSV